MYLFFTVEVKYTYLRYKRMIYPTLLLFFQTEDEGREVTNIGLRLPRRCILG